jgi:hypothetical protein
VPIFDEEDVLMEKAEDAVARDGARVTDASG